MLLAGREGKDMFNKGLTEMCRKRGVRREPDKKRAAKKRLSGVNREASNRVAPTTR
jgi:hypothetical protein